MGTSVGLVLLLTGGCTRAVPEFTNEFGSKPQQTSGGSEDAGTGEGDGDGDEVEPDLPAPTPTCELSEGELCPPGQNLKCVPGHPDGGFDHECVEVLGELEVGASCSLDPNTNTDACDASSYCYAGTCRAMCGAGAACPQIGACWQAAWLCIAGCDPLAQDCPAQLACEWTQDESYAFQCTDAGGQSEGQACMGSIHDSTCGPGLGCVPELQYPGGCVAAPGGGCCSPLCNTEDGQAGCEGAQGESCLSAELEALPWLGACGGASFAAGDIVISEVYANPPGVTINEYRFEYVELLNASGQDIELGLLAIDDFVGPGPDNILERFDVVGGSGGCVGGSSSCLAPGRRALFIGDLYEGETNGALVFSAENYLIFDALLQPWSRIEVFEENSLTLLSSYRDWPEPGGPPLPDNELPMHRLELAGPDAPGNWAELPPSPGF